MLSTKPYLVRAFNEWILDSQCTPFVAINATVPNCHVPKEHIEDGEIIFNISPLAVRDLKINNETLEFKASFSGFVRTVSVPIKAILAIYAEENGQGMFFDNEEEDTTGISGWTEEGSAITQQTESSTNDKKKPSHLRLVD